VAKLVSWRSELDAARHDLEAAQDNEAAHEHLQALYREEAIIRAYRDAISSATTDLLDTTIRPLAVDLSVRWSTMFPGRGQLRIQSNGEVTRELNGDSLPYSAFSTGERTGLVILLRLLVLEASTKANFCWFDEPLEHLDPEARRHVAEALARASSMGRLNQIVVSTYEEPLARRLQERDPDNVKLIYVRQSSN
jgi:DNA repair exonuclease SbcCD ATPase subunit